MCKKRVLAFLFVGLIVFSMFGIIQANIFTDFFKKASVTGEVVMDSEEDFLNTLNLSGENFYVSKKADVPDGGVILTDSF